MPTETGPPLSPSLAVDNEIRKENYSAFVRHVLRYSEWHGDRLRRVPQDVRDLANLRTLPTMGRSDVSQYLNQIITHQRLPKVGKDVGRRSSSSHMPVPSGLVVTQTGGSGGQPIPVLATEDEIASDSRLLINHALFLAEVNPLRSRAQLSLASVTSTYPAYERQQLTRRSDLIKCVTLDMSLPASQLGDQLIAADPSMLFIYPSLLAQLLDTSKRLLSRLRPRVVILGAEPYVPGLRESIAELWDAKTIIAWGSTETGLLAMSCGPECDGMRVLGNRAIVEFLDAEWNPVAAGQLADCVLVTPLVRRLLPLVRYLMPDQVRVFGSESTPCSNGHPHVAQIVGRSGQDLVTSDGASARSVEIAEAIGSALANCVYEVRRIGTTLRIEVVAPRNLRHEKVSERVTEYLKQARLIGMRVTVSPKTHLSRSVPAQKWQPFRDLTTVNLE